MTPSNWLLVFVSYFGWNWTEYTLLLVALLAVTHYIGDFILQNNWMALNKSKWTEVLAKDQFPPDYRYLEGVKALGTHVLIYAGCFLWVGVDFAAITFLLHLVTDAITSRITAKNWYIENLGGDYPTGKFVGRFDDAKRKKFWRTIGLDQTIHLISLILTLWWLS